LPIRSALWQGGVPSRDLFSINNLRQIHSAGLTLRPSVKRAEIILFGKTASQMGITADQPLTVLGDGAAWIGNRADEPFPRAAQLLDLFHASQPVAAATRVLMGEGTEAGRVWVERVRRRLLGTIGPVGALRSARWSRRGYRRRAGRLWTSWSAPSPARGAVWAPRGVCARVEAAAVAAGEAVGASLESGRPRLGCRPHRPECVANNHGEQPGVG
jgi:hypothetical protein